MTDKSCSLRLPQRWAPGHLACHWQHLCQHHTRKGWASLQLSTRPPTEEWAPKSLQDLGNCSGLCLLLHGAVVFWAAQAS